MKAFLIDPVAKTITEVEHKTDGKDGGLRDIYTLLGCDLIDIVRMRDGDGAYVDDEGLLKSPSPDSFWAMPELYGEVAAWTGKGLVLGSDAKGVSTEPKITLDELKRIVVFLSPDQLLTYISAGEDE
jgi:hypothetical protein